MITSVNCMPVRDASGKVVMAVITVEDITARKQAEQALIRSEKLASVGRMAATIAHEINNPLEAVMNALFLAKSVEAEAPRASTWTSPRKSCGGSPTLPGSRWDFIANPTPRRCYR